MDSGLKALLQSETQTHPGFELGSLIPLSFDDNHSINHVSLKPMLFIKFDQYIPMLFKSIQTFEIQEKK